MGLRGDMKLETVAGPKSIEELWRISQQEPGYSIPVISFSGLKVSIAIASEFKQLGRKQIIEVLLDDGAKLYVSASTQFAMKSGEPKLAPELVPGDSLLPFYTGHDRNGHRIYRDPDAKRSEKFVRLIGSWKIGRPLERGDYFELLDGDKNNYHPNNLRHTHNKAKATKRRTYGIVSAAREANELIAEWENMGGPNHKIITTELGGLEMVYSAVIERSEVVAVSGVFVKLPC